MCWISLDDTRVYYPEEQKAWEKKITVNSVLLGLLSGPCWLLLGEDALVSSWEARLSWVVPAILCGKAIRQSPLLFLHRPSGTHWRSPADSSPLLTPPAQPQSLGAAGALQPASSAFRDLHNTYSHMLRAHGQGHLGHEKSGPWFAGRNEWCRWLFQISCCDKKKKKEIKF